MSDARDAGDPTRRNRLDVEGSPYLRQHADNPVHWQPWDDAALAAARERDVPIFLSIGYSACHWCHVMEEESFQDEGIARLLNEGFVPIKVDREERPDLDSVYMTVCQQVTGRGGWPLSAWLTPEGKPFYVGTYFPKESRAGQPGFRGLLEDVREAWETDREEIEQRAEQWARLATEELEDVDVDAPAAEPGPDLLERAAEAMAERADRAQGGFGRAPKFPQPRRLRLLLAADRRTGREEFRGIATEALDAMASGGIHDHLGGGFHRYATDRDWTVPHFEKMLYDNAEIPRAFLEGYRATGDERYADVVRRALAFVERELSHPDGGFYSTLDARSRPPRSRDRGGASPDGDEADEAEEGAFYVWTPGEIEAAVDDDLRAELLCERYGVTDAGNFEGRTVLTLSKPVGALAEAHGLSTGAVEEHLAAGVEALLAAREERPRPARDEKVLAGWNGLAISTFAEAGLALDERYAERAVEALTFVRERLWDAETGRLARRYREVPEDGEIRDDVKGEGYLEDYAFLARGALDCYAATGEVDHLAFAVDLARAIEAEFWDADAGTLYFTPASGERLLARPQELSDGSTPSSAGVAAELLAALAAFVPDAAFGEIAERVVETHAGRIEERPAEHPTLAAAADALAVGHLELTTVADGGLPAAWLEGLGRAHLPDRLLAPRPADPEAFDRWLDALDVSEAPPIWAGRDAEEPPTIYVCRRACSPPLASVDAAFEWIEDLEPR